jgi:coenzyme F420-reducing hydrogenase alpha subunit
MAVEHCRIEKLFRRSGNPVVWINISQGSSIKKGNKMINEVSGYEEMCMGLLIEFDRIKI